MKDYACYLFDLDGTLIDTAELIYQCFKYSCRMFGNSEVGRDAVIRHIGLPLRRQLEVHLGPLTDGRAEEIMGAHMEYQLSIYKRYLRAFPTVAEGLAALKRRGKKLGVVTSRRQRTLHLYLGETGLEDSFDVFVSPEMTLRHKPDPEPVLKALELLNCPRGQALLVGDSGFDIECGANAGVDTAFVSWSHTPESSLAIRPTQVIDDVRSLAAAGGQR